MGGSVESLGVPSQSFPGGSNPSHSSGNNTGRGQANPGLSLYTHIHPRKKESTMQSKIINIIIVAAAILCFYGAASTWDRQDAAIEAVLAVPSESESPVIPMDEPVNIESDGELAVAEAPVVVVPDQTIVVQRRVTGAGAARRRSAVRSERSEAPEIHGAVGVPVRLRLSTPGALSYRPLSEHRSAPAVKVRLSEETYRDPHHTH